AANIDKIHTLFEKDAAEYESTIISEDDRALYTKLMAAAKAYFQSTDRVIAFSEKMENEKALELFKGENSANYDAAAQILTQMVDLNKKGSKDATAAARSLYDTTMMFLAGCIALVLVILAWALTFVSRNISAPITNITGVMGALAGGDKA